jgi:hypothetical protein
MCLHETFVAKSTQSTVQPSHISLNFGELVDTTENSILAIFQQLLFAVLLCRGAEIVKKISFHLVHCIHKKLTQLVLHKLQSSYGLI